jgi:hypothetical protein
MRLTKVSAVAEAQAESWLRARVFSRDNQALAMRAAVTVRISAVPAKAISQ